MSAMYPVSFDNGEGLRLHGIMHEPDASKRKSIAVLLLSPGVKMRVAPHRLYNKMAARFVALGYPVFRFDFYGLGDAEGDIEEDKLADLYGSIQIGRYVGDTQAAMQWLSEEHGVGRFLLAGLCGGAITGLLAARGDARVEGLLGLGIPVILDSAQMDKSRFLTEGQIDSLRQRYISKLISPRYWLRLLTFQSDYKVIWRILKRKLFSPKEVPASDNNDTPVESDDNTNPLFAPAFFDMVDSGRKIRFIFSGSDRLDWEYEEKFVSRHSEQLKQCAEHFEISVIPEANHILSMSEWQQVMLDQSADWLNKHFS